jgi:glycosyltransferase involved in cell wall biosynthesis
VSSHPRATPSRRDVFETEVADAIPSSGRRNAPESRHTSFAALTIVVIALNEERQIASCLDALLGQSTDLKYEVVVVDDGSSDSTTAIVKQFQARFSNLRLICHERNLGRGAARYTGQVDNKLPFIGFVDSDIVVPPDWIERCVSELPKADGVSGIALPDGDCAVVWRLCKPTLRVRAGTSAITGNNVIFSREALNTVPFSSEARLGEDFRQARLMLRAGLKLRTIDELIVNHLESKTYARAVGWMYRSGVDATALLFEFGEIRIPDLAWFAWVATMVTLAAASLWEVLPLWISTTVAMLVWAAINAMFVFSRFTPRHYPLRFAASVVVNAPLMLAYLLGRTAGPLIYISTRIRAFIRNRAGEYHGKNG